MQEKGIGSPIASALMMMMMMMLMMMMMMMMMRSQDCQEKVQREVPYM